MLWLLYTIIDALVNWYIIVKKKTSPNHLSLTLIRGMAAIVWGGAVVHLTPDHFLSWAIYLVTSFWVLFDLSLNLLRELSPFYIGETSFIDKAGRAQPVFYWILKFTALVCALHFVHNF